MYIRWWLPNMKSRERLSSDISRKKLFVTWYYICERVWTLFADSHSQPEPGLSKDLGFFRNFGNPSNFDELYLRAQEIFFDGTGTVAKIYV